MTTILNLKPDEPRIVDVPLSDIIHLEATTFQLPEHATRPLDKEHVLALAATNGVEKPTWPPIEVVSTDEGLAVIDGYHRLAAIERNLWLKLLGIYNELPEKATKAIQAAMAIPQEVELFNTAKHDTVITVHIGDYPSEKAVAKAALTANLKHGLPPKAKALVFIALELYDITRFENPEPSQAEIARQVGISRATLNEYLKKRETAKTKEPEPTETEQADTETLPEVEQVSAAEADSIDKAVKKAQALLKFLKGLFDAGEEKAFYEGFSVLFSETINAFIDENAGVDVKELAETIRYELDIAPTALENDLIPYVKFAQAFTLAMRLGKPKVTKKAKGKEQQQDTV